MALHLPDDSTPNDNNKPKSLTLRKIPLYDLLKLFEHLYNGGADYIDILGVSKEPTEQDELVVSVQAEYLNEKMEEEPEETEEEEEERKASWGTQAEEAKSVVTPKLTRDDINNLL